MSEAGGEGRVGDLDGEVFRVELLAKPFEAFGAFGMGRVCEDLEQLLITPGTAAILRRTRALACDAGRVGRSLSGRKGLFDRDGVLPVVAEVLGVGEADDAGSVHGA